jgi:hypothetical protein
MKCHITEDEFYPFLFLEECGEDDLEDNQGDEDWYWNDVYDIPEELVDKYEAMRKELRNCNNQLKEIMKLRK